ncbi:MAG: hypothetical protein BGO49_11285 [Planctomycetales bacterium 71-10]|nr:MAG: hypothetical protein BGO49_11285 [Planctomycetales bacterium 71-10]
MPSLHNQKLGIRDRIFEAAGVRHREMWKTEAEDEFVRLVLGLYHDLPAHQLRRVAELLECHAVHMKGDSRTSLMAMLDDGKDGLP